MLKINEHTIPFFFIVSLSIFVFALFYFQEQKYVGETGVPLDDSWIHFQFARNVADGRGFSYNPSEMTPGSTSPLWVFILAGAYRVTHDFILTSKLLGLFFLLVSVSGIYTISLIISSNRQCAFFIALLTVLSGRLTWGAFSGMEIGLFTSLTIWGIFFYMKYETSSPKIYFSTILFGLATLARPEGAALFLFALIGSAWRTFQKRGENICEMSSLKRLVGLSLHVLIFFAIVFPQILFCLQTSGRPLPNTFYAKTHGIELSVTSVLYLVKVAYFFFRDHPVLFFVLPFGLWKAVTAVYKGCSKQYIIVVWFLGLPVLDALINPVMWHHGRYVMFLIPFFFLFSLNGLFFILDRQRLAKTRLKEGVLAVSLLISIGILFHWSKVYAQNVDNINQMDVRMGQWLAANLPQNAVVAASDVGAIAFFSGRTIIDTDGLVTSDIIPYLKEMERERGVFQYLFDRKPDFVVAFYNEFQFLTARSDMFEPVFSLRLTRNTILGGDRMVVYKAHWSRSK